MNQQCETNVGKFNHNTVNDQIPKWVAKTFKEKQLQGRRGSIQFIALKQLEHLSSGTGSSLPGRKYSNFGFDKTIEDMTLETLQSQ